MITTIGFAKHPNGAVKLHFGTSTKKFMQTRFKSAQLTDIEIFEIPDIADRRESVQWLIANQTLSPDQLQIAQAQLNRRELAHNQQQKAQQLTAKISQRVKTNESTDPRIQAFIEKTLGATND